MTHKDGKYAGGDAWFQGFSTNLAFDPLGFGKAVRLAPVGRGRPWTVPIRTPRWSRP